MFGPRVLTLLVGLYMSGAPCLGHPHHPHHAHLHGQFHSLVESRDEGSQPVCPPVPDSVVTGADLLAKVRLPPGDTCAVESRAFRTLDADDPYSCSQTKPCSNGACCAKTGVCGYGPASCGTSDESPNDKCWSNCDAHAECGRFAEKPGQECPLKVCCSEHGFCGMTSEYCDKSDEEDEGCQSNCEQPGSGSSGGDVQKRVIGYYEAWNAGKKCIGMSMEDIPVNSLTHIYYSFAYIKPDIYDIIPMEDEKDGTLTEDSFMEFTALKRKNPSLKAVVALGGWTFNDNGTVWQPVFGDLASTEEKRGRFVDKLISFMDRYGFDGADIDWEYPGAPDRGGKEGDGENLTKLFKKMREEFDKMSGDRKEISFTAPTSYWYMRHFDITASAKAVDYVNVMSYDLHGIWDANNPIGSQVLAHTNLTEIDLALDLFWRNDVEASKINLGLGFYGRSFQLADPSCHKPGCLFLGGASPGHCTDNSGTLSYAEIMDIIEKHDLNPYHDEKNAVKYITWNSDQWVSYDDQETMQQKIEFANALGLGGLLIWAIDLDTQNLDALRGVIYPDSFGVHKDQSTLDPWEELGEGHCTVTKCGTTGCRQGEIEVKEFTCNRWHGKKRSVCCPFASAPDPDKCKWRGNGVACNGQCHAGEVALASATNAGGGYPCLDGHKFLCCEAEAKQPDCRWTGCKDDCNSDEEELTWKYSNCSGDKKKKFCCSKDQGWTNCKWKGKGGSCFDNHCDTGWQVALTRSWGAEDTTCGLHSRKRTFCCDAPDGQSPFLPVPLEYLFPDAPDEEEADPDFTLKVDNTWGGEEEAMFQETPDYSAFGFVIMTSPIEIQVSLDKRDGSHWEVFDCFDSETQGEHNVRMICTTNEGEESSTCNDIHRGHGAPGTIIQLPEGCGPGKYGVAKEVTPSLNQTLPHHLARRGLQETGGGTTIYDLKFDYDFNRVPRDLGDTQLRIDYSNEPMYWDTVVDRAADSSKKKNKKRSLGDVGGDHRTWLEEEWRDDVHFGGLSAEDIHKRWFGDDVLEWLRQLLSGVTGDISHAYSEDFILQIVDQDLQCPNLDAKLEVSAETHVDLDVNYGFTLIAKLGGDSGIDLSDSYLYFRTKGEVTATFVIDAAATVHFDTDDVLMFSADSFGAAFTVPGIVTIGPNFKLFGRLEGEATLGVNVESRVKLAAWDTRQTFPVANDDWDPEASKDPDKDGTQSILDPEFEYGIQLSGHLTAHVKPTVTFGIDFDKSLLDIDSCAVNLVADGHVTFHAEAELGSGGSSFCYGVDAGADLYATIDAPDAFSWALPKSPFPIVPVDDVTLYPKSGGTECISSNDARRRQMSNKHTERNVTKRSSNIYGPLVPRIDGLGCPGDEDVGGEAPPCAMCSEIEDDGDDRLARRQDDGDDDDEGDSCWIDPYATELSCPSDSSTKRGLLEARATKKKEFLWEGYYIPMGVYPTCGDAQKSYSSIQRWWGYPTVQPGGCESRLRKLNGNQVNKANFVTEHIYEMQMIKAFLEWLHGAKLPVGYIAPSRAWVTEVLVGVNSNRVHKPSNYEFDTTCAELSKGLGGIHNHKGLVLADESMNGRKEFIMMNKELRYQAETSDLKTRLMHRHTVGVFHFMSDGVIWDKFRASSQWMEEVFREFDKTYPWGGNNPINQGEPKRPSRGRDQPEAGLRDLYCFWIDEHLGSIEATMRQWHSAALSAYENKFKGTTTSDNWVNKKLKNGDLSIDQVRFPRSLNRHKGKSSSLAGADIWSQSNYKDLWKTGNGFGAAGPF